MILSEEYAQDDEHKALVKDATRKWLWETLVRLESGTVLAANRSSYEHFGSHVVIELVFE